MPSRVEELEHDSGEERRRDPRPSSPRKAAAADAEEVVVEEVTAERPAGNIRERLGKEATVAIAEEDKFVNAYGKVWDYSEDEDDD